MVSIRSGAFVIYAAKIKTQTQRGSITKLETISALLMWQHYTCQCQEKIPLAIKVYPKDKKYVNRSKGISNLHWEIPASATSMHLISWRVNRIWRPTKERLGKANYDLRFITITVSGLDVYKTQIRISETIEPNIPHIPKPYHPYTSLKTLYYSILILLITLKQNCG